MKYLHGALMAAYGLLKPDLKMKLTYFLFFIALIQIQAKGFGQNIFITIDLDNVTVEKAFDQIEVESGLKFLYNTNYINLGRKVTVVAKELRLEKVLNKVFKGTNVTYSILDKQIILKLRSKEKIPEVKEEVPIEEVQQTISGSVFDNDGIPLAGVSILVKGTQRGVSTDFDGLYSINVANDEVLVFSYLGFFDKEVVVGDDSSYDIQMIVSSLKLDGVDVVSTGYQTISKERATGSFERVEEKVLKAKINQNIISKIEGEFPGLVFGAGGSIIVRGLSSISADTEPLIVVDGFPIESGTETINPNDVESVTVLKDAAAASIWGIRATNGVIVIITKKGNRNNLINVEVTLNTAITPEPNLFDNFIGDPATQVAYQTALFDGGGTYNPGQIFSGDLNPNSLFQIDPVAEILLQQQIGAISPAEGESRLQELANTDARHEYNKLVSRPAQWQQYNLALSGGGEKHDFRGSLSYNQNDNQVVGTNDKQIIANLTNSVDISSKLKLRGSINFSETKQNLSQPIGVDGISFAAPLSNAPTFLLSSPITSRILDDNGNYLPMIGGAYQNASDFALTRGVPYPWTYNLKQELDNSDNVIRTTALRLQTALEYELFRNLSLNLSYQYEWSQINQRALQNENTFSTRNLINLFTQYDASGIANENIIPQGAILDLSAQTNRAHTVRTQANYNTRFGGDDHDLTAILGYEVRKTVFDLNTDRKYGFDEQSLASIRPDFTRQFLLPLSPIFPTAAIPSNSSIGFIENRFVSYYANAAYTYANKYTLSASTRLDDTNLFGASDEFRNIPLYSVGAKWNIFNEGTEYGTISALQFRATYGINGNVDRNTSPQLQASIQQQLFPFTTLGGFIQSVPNPTLRLEKTRTLNLGLDFGFFENKINGSVEYYKKNSEDLLANQILNPTSGVSSALLNVGELSNQGVDAQLSILVADKEDFQYRTSGNFSVNTNKIIKADATGFDITSFTGIFGTLATIEDEALQTIFSYRFAGLDRNGAPQFLDSNNDIVDFRTNIPDIEALTNEGTLIPKYYGSWINEISYKDISLRVLTTFKAGHVFRYSNPLDGFSPSYVPFGFSAVNVPQDFNDRWQQPGDENRTTIPAFPSNFSDSFAVGYTNLLTSNEFVDSASHIRLRQVSLGYNLPENFLKKSGISNIQISIQGENLAIWDFNKWGVDPENNFIPVRPTYTLNITASF